MALLSAKSPLHVPVLLDEVLAAAAIQPGECHVDATFGAGGYTRAMLAAGANVHSFDRDPDAIREGAALVAAAKGTLTLHHARFSELARVLAQAGIRSVDGVVFDIGVSSMQIDRAERGFSFQKDGPLDFRMSQSGETAADFLNTASEATIADIIFLYGEERQSRRIARAIVAARPLETTLQLAQIVRKALGFHPGMPKDPATRTFQSLRIHINDELGELERGLAAAEAILRPGGRIIIVTFQSLEDRIVKNFLRQRSGSQASGSRHVPDAPKSGPVPSFAKPSKAIRAGEAECKANPRARSATLRWAVRTAAPAWQQGSAAA